MFGARYVVWVFPETGECVEACGRYAADLLKPLIYPAVRLRLASSAAGRRRCTGLGNREEVGWFSQLQYPGCKRRCGRCKLVGSMASVWPYSEGLGRLLGQRQRASSPGGPGSMQPVWSYVRQRLV